MNGFDAETIQGWRDEGIAKLGERGWAVAARLLASDIHWLKGGWGRQDELARCWDILEDLLDMGVEVKPRREPWLARFELAGVPYSIRGGGVQELSTAVRCQDTPLAWRVLALTPDDDHSRMVQSRGQDLVVELGLPLDRPVAELAAGLVPLRLAYEEVLDDPGADPEWGEHDLRASFAEAGIGSPRWPAPLARKLARRDRWYWSTSVMTEQPHRMQDYLMEERDFLLGPVADHLTISHGGHSVNSYALSLRVAYGPVGLHVQEAFGGGYSDSAFDHGRVTELLHRVGSLLRTVGDTRVSERKRARDLVLHLSSFRGIAELRLWDHDLRTWQEQRFDPTSHEIWSRAEKELERRHRQHSSR